MVPERRAAVAFSTVLELLFPGRCLLCGTGLVGRAAAFFPVCSACLADLAPLRDTRRCEVCSIPLISEAAVCTRCRAREYGFGRNHALFEYRGSIRELIFQYKFKARKRAARAIAGLLGDAYAARFGSLPAVPVPGHPRNVRKRGWDPMLEVGRALGAMYGIPVMNPLRRGASREQKGLGFEERLANMQGTITLRSGASPLPPALVLIDDVFTTGATASECARVLRLGGAQDIEVLTLAID